MPSPFVLTNRLQKRSSPTIRIKIAKIYTLKMLTFKKGLHFQLGLELQTLFVANLFDCFWLYYCLNMLQVGQGSIMSQSLEV